MHPIWPASGTFTLVAGNAGLFNLKRNDNVLVTVTELAPAAIKFNLQYTSPAGRSKSVSGQYAFTMSR